MKSIKKKGLTIIATIMMMGFVTAVVAQVPQTQPENNMGTRQEHKMHPQEQHQQMLPENAQEHKKTHEKGVVPQEQNQLGEVGYNEEIEKTELPATVTASLETRYPDYEVKKVYQGTDNSYKVKVKNGDEKSVVYFDSNGTFLKEEQDKDKDENKDKNKDW